MVGVIVIMGFVVGVIVIMGFVVGVIVIMPTSERGQPGGNRDDGGPIGNVGENDVEQDFLKVVTVDEDDVGFRDCRGRCGRRFVAVDIDTRRDQRRHLRVIPGNGGRKLGDQRRGSGDPDRPIVSGGGSLAATGARGDQSDQEQESRCVAGLHGRAFLILHLDPYRYCVSSRDPVRQDDGRPSRVLGVAVGAAPVELEAMRVDVESGAGGDAFEFTLEAVAGELRDAPTFGTDDVMVVIGLVIVRELVDGGSVVQHDLADDAEFPHQLHRSKDGGATDRGRRDLDFFGGEVVAQHAHGVEHRASRIGESITATREGALDRIGCGHAVMVPRGVPVCQSATDRA